MPPRRRGPLEVDVKKAPKDRPEPEDLPAPGWLPRDDAWDDGPIDEVVRGAKRTIK